MLAADFTFLSRYDPDDMATIVASWSGTGVAFPAGTPVKLGGRNVHTLVFQTGRAARIEDYASASGPAAGIGREFGLRGSVGVPISVEGRLWGVMFVAHTGEEPLPAGTEARLAGFHRPGRDRDRECGGAHGGARIRRGAGGAAAGGDAGGPGGAAG